MSEVEKCYQDFWKDICETNGQIDTEAVKKELYDFKQLMIIFQDVVNMFGGVSGVSKINYPAYVYKNALDEHVSAQFESEKEEWQLSLSARDERIARAAFEAARACQPYPSEGDVEAYANANDYLVSDEFKKVRGRE
jgi:hypothetical protein